MRVVIFKWFKSLKKDRVLNHMQRLAIILLDPKCDDSQCYFCLRLTLLKIIILIQKFKIKHKILFFERLKF